MILFSQFSFLTVCTNRVSLLLGRLGRATSNLHQRLSEADRFLVRGGVATKGSSITYCSHQDPKRMFSAAFCHGMCRFEQSNLLLLVIGKTDSGGLTVINGRRSLSAATEPQPSFPGYWSRRSERLSNLASEAAFGSLKVSDSPHMQ